MENTNLKKGDVIVIKCGNNENIAIFDCIKEPGFNPATTLHIYIEMDINEHCFESLILKEKDYDFSYDLDTISYRLATNKEKNQLYKSIGNYFAGAYDTDWYNHFTDSSYFDIQDYLLDIFCIEINEYDDDLIYPDFINDIHTYIWDKLCEAMGVPNTVEDKPEMVNKQKFIEKAWQWLKAHIKIETISYNDVWDISIVEILATDFTTVDEMEESFRKTMEE
jgi:hypothetical protein